MQIFSGLAGKLTVPLRPTSLHSKDSVIGQLKLPNFNSCLLYIYIYIYYIEKDVLGANTGTDVFCLNSEYVSCLQDCLLLSSEFVVAIKFHSLFIKTEVAYDVSTVAFDFILNYIYLTEQQTVRVLFDSAE